MRLRTVSGATAAMIEAPVWKRGQLFLSQNIAIIFHKSFHLYERKGEVVGEIDGWGQGNSKRHRDKERVGSNEEPDGYEVLVKCHMHIVYMYNCTCTKYRKLYHLV